jgi:hypothetical protein
MVNESSELIARLLDSLDHGWHHHEDPIENSLEVLILRAGDLRESRDLSLIVAWRHLRYAVVHFQSPILTRWSGKLCIRVLLRVIDPPHRVRESSN